MSNELWRKSAVELARVIKQGEATSREVVEAHLERIEQVNGSLNAVTVVLADTALAAADLADTTDAIGPFHGVPFSIKENIDCAGSATTQGVPALVEAFPPIDSPTVARMKAAGAIPIARTNLPEFGLRISTDNPLRGRTNNVWDSTLTAGGSSGGEAVAIASGMSPIGLGNDIGGSLRNPAFCNGICSLKPTRGRIPRADSLPPQDPGLSGQLMAVEGPMARRVIDLRTALGVLAGYDPRDPGSVPAALEGPPPARRVAALVTELPGGPIGASVLDAIQSAGKALADAGWEIVDTNPPELQLVSDLWAYTLSFDLEFTLPLLTEFLSSDAVSLLERLIEAFPSSSMPPQLANLERRRLERLWAEFFVEHPVVIGPTWAHDPFPHDADLDPDSGVDMATDRLRFITPGNVLGLPSVCIPTGTTATGLAAGVQIYADKWREDLTLEAAEAIEDRLGIITPTDPH